MPLPVPDFPWQHISMDFITGLPLTRAQHNMIWTIIDRFSKQAYFIPCKKTLSAKQAALLFLKHIFVQHGLPQSIISDRDTRFCNDFWVTLFTNLGTNIDFTSAFHPESNGQTEATNSTILDLLRTYTHDRPGTWDTYIHLLQFAYNNTPHSSTGKSPFEIVYGYSLPTPLSRISNEVPHADDIAQQHTQILEQAKHAIHKAQANYVKQANKKRKPMEFKEGDFVMLRIEKRRLKSVETHPVVKLAPRYYGPFKITKRINANSFRLDIPDTWNIHNAFHISLLRPFKGPLPTLPILDDPPLLADDSEILVPEAIIDHQATFTRSGLLHHKYLLKYKNHGLESAKWMPERFFRSHPNILEAYQSSQN